MSESTTVSRFPREAALTKKKPMRDVKAAMAKRRHSGKSRAMSGMATATRLASIITPAEVATGRRSESMVVRNVVARRNPRNAAPVRALTS